MDAFWAVLIRFRMQMSNHLGFVRAWYSTGTVKRYCPGSPVRAWIPSGFPPHGTASPDCLQNGQGWWWLKGGLFAVVLWQSQTGRVWVGSRFLEGLADRSVAGVD